MTYRSNAAPPPLPLVVALNCIEDTGLEQECLAGVATVEHVPLSRLAGRRSNPPPPSSFTPLLSSPAPPNAVSAPGSSSSASDHPIDPSTPPSPLT
ncbi:hypothetical protein U1Q18_013280 [Sarracenia purpurea var. burkii]